MHHSRVALPVVFVEKVKHILLKLLTVYVDVFSCLLKRQLPIHTRRDTVHLVCSGQVYFFRESGQPPE
jgi:hypothetical protein